MHNAEDAGCHLEVLRESRVRDASVIVALSICSKSGLLKKLRGGFQKIEPFLSGTWMVRSRRARRIHFRKPCLIPLIRTGEQPNPNRETIALRCLSSRRNHDAHSGTAGKPYRHATRYSTKTGSSSHKIVRAPSRSVPGFVFANSAETATMCRTGRFLPGTMPLPRKHWASGPREALAFVWSGNSIRNEPPSATAADNAPISESPPIIESKWAVAEVWSPFLGSRTARSR